jgi:tryptophan-rich sensory protein
MKNEFATTQDHSLGTHSLGTKIAVLVASLAICFFAAFLGNLATGSSLSDWYPQLNKPTWNPPNWIFGPVWSTLYTMMAVAAWLVWLKAGFRAAKIALILFAIQLALNSLWSILFFGMQNPGAALIEITVLWIAIALTIFYFAKHSKLAAGLLVPYLCWVTFASFLNFTIWNLNR